MNENLKNTESLSIVNDGKMKDSLEKLLKVTEEISENEEKIIFQRDEMEKTKKMIEQYEEYYDTQKKALEHFCAEKERLSSEHELLIFEVNTLQSEEILKNIKKRELQMICDIDDRNEKPPEESVSKMCEDIPTSESSMIIENQMKEEKKGTSLAAVTVRKEMSSLAYIIKKKLKQSKKKQKCCIQRSNKKHDSTDVLNKIKKDDINSLLKKYRKDDKPPKSATLDEAVSEEIPIVKKLICSNSKIKLKISTTPLVKLYSIDCKYLIHRILMENNESLICGSHGLLFKYSRLSFTYYYGHEDYYVYNVYKYLNLIVSFGIDYVLFHCIQNSKNHKMRFSFTSKISSTCLYKSLIYGILDDGVMFIIDLDKEKVQCHGPILPPSSKAMLVIESSNGILNLIVGNNNGLISRYNLSEVSLQSVEIGKVEGRIKGLITDGNILISYSDHQLYLINKYTWELTLIREMANAICHVDMCLSRVVVIDNCNILHKYVIKKGLISSGSTVESLTIASKISALQICAQAKKVFLASKSDVFSKKL